MKLRKPRILYIKQKSFNAKTVQNDYDILSEEFEINFYNVNTTNNIFIFYTLFKQFLYFIIFGFKYHVYYMWFNDYHSFIPVLISSITRSKTIINVGGYDATNIPEIKCGAFNKDTLKGKIRAFILEYNYRHCDFIITVDDSLINNINTYIYSDDINQKPLHDGILNYMPDLHTPIKTVYTCYDPKYFCKEDKVNKERIVLSVGLTPNKYEFKRKGFDMLVEAAKIMNDVKFIIIGVSQDQYNELKLLSLSNLDLYTFLPIDKFMPIFQKAKVFVQLSLFEGLPNTLCEAMLCECIPVGSNVNGIPTALGDCGFLVNKKDIEEIVSKINKALVAPDEQGKKARLYIQNNFTYQKRKKELFDIINKLINVDENS